MPLTSAASELSFDFRLGSPGPEPGAASAKRRRRPKTATPADVKTDEWMAKRRLNTERAKANRHRHIMEEKQQQQRWHSAQYHTAQLRSEALQLHALRNALRTTLGLPLMAAPIPESEALAM